LDSHPQHYSLAKTRVFILAGGLGTRIRALFPDLPKPLVPIQGKPFLEWQIELLICQGFSYFVLCVGYKAEQIIQQLGNGDRWGVTIEYSVETTLLGTAGALKHAQRFFQQTAFVVNGDTFFSTNYLALLEQHYHQKTVGSLGLVTSQDLNRYGQVTLGNANRVKDFSEKAPLQSQTGLVNSGVYVLEPQVLDYIASGRSVSIEREVFPTLATEGNLCGYPITGEFVDMGTPDGYEMLVKLLSRVF
jgi:NDP-sugar pyrophosphorylase family protein